MRYSYLLFNKPYGVLSQFTDREGRSTLSDFGPFPKDVYTVGRLDFDSEGLLLLTNDHEAQHQLTDPGFAHTRTYLVQVEGVPTERALRSLGEGIVIEGRRTKPAQAELLTVEPELPPREKPIRYRKNIPTAWIRMTLSEGRNRQVRHMTAAVGFPTLRLVRIRIGAVELGSLAPGKKRELNDEEAARLLKGISRRRPRR